MCVCMIFDMCSRVICIACVYLWVNEHVSVLGTIGGEAMVYTRRFGWGMM